MNAVDFSPTRTMFDASVQGQLVEDISQIVRCAPFIARMANRHFTPGLASELADAVDLLNCKVADLKEAEGASR
jgi:hypothetical protein